ncbi:MAG: polymer-forming cytoskeletal protein [Ferruginibacter sp.]
MFNSKAKLFAGELSTGNTTIIDAAPIINDDIESDGDIRKGSLNGRLLTKSKIFIGPEGTMEANINGQQSDVPGKVCGQIKIKELP